MGKDSSLVLPVQPLTSFTIYLLQYEYTIIIIKKPIDWGFSYIYVVCVDCSHIPKTSHYSINERSIIIKKYFAYYNQYKNGIDIAFDDNVLLFLSCAEAEKNLHTTSNSQRLIDNLAIDEPLEYAALALDDELQAWADAMDEEWCP